MHYSFASINQSRGLKSPDLCVDDIGNPMRLNDLFYSIAMTGYLNVLGLQNVIILKIPNKLLTVLDKRYFYSYKKLGYNNGYIVIGDSYSIDCSSCPHAYRGALEKKIAIHNASLISYDMLCLVSKKSDIPKFYKEYPIYKTFYTGDKIKYTIDNEESYDLFEEP